ncbi:MAG: hypothetical protein WBX01_04770 [Nitrososphaeraceae archaeon]
MNEGADFWRHDIGMNVIPAVSKAKTLIKGCYQQQYQNASISQEQHEKWKAEKSFKD